MVSKRATNLSVFLFGYIFFSVIALSRIGGLAIVVEGTNGVTYTCSCSSGFMLGCG